MNETKGSLHNRYEALASDRSAFLDRARDNAKYTIPTLVPPDGAGKHTKYPTPYQSTGARGVNNLSAKLLLALMPPSTSFFRLGLPGSAYEAQTANEEQAGDLKVEIEAALAKIEARVLSDLEAKGARVSLAEGLKQLIVAGNVLLYFLPEGGIRVFKLDRYAVKRAPTGKVMEIIVKEIIVPNALTPEVLSRANIVPGENGKYGDDEYSLYTGIRWDNTDAVYEVSQELNGETISSNKGTFPEGIMPWLALRFTAVDGEDYGRSYVEEYIGDILSLEGLTQAIVEGAAAAAKLLFLVDPNGSTRKKTLTDSPNTAVVSGRAQDVTTLQADKFADFSVAKQVIDALKSDLAFAFLLNTAIQRKGERVTAQEIRYMAQELESALGGVYSVLSRELLSPLVRITMRRMTARNLLPEMPMDQLELTITTGMEALGRNTELQKQQQFLEVLTPLDPKMIAEWIEVPNWIKRTATNVGLGSEGLIKTEERVKQDRIERAQQEAMARGQPAGPQQTGAPPNG